MDVMSLFCSWFLGASAGVKVNLFEKAIKWCDEGLAVSYDSIFFCPRAQRVSKTTVGGGGGGAGGWEGGRQEVKGCVPSASDIYIIPRQRQVIRIIPV